MNGLHLKARTALALGPLNLLRVFGYRVSLRNPLSGVRRLRATFASGPFFTADAQLPRRTLPVPEVWRHGHRYFGWHVVPSRDAPDWYRNPFNGQRVAGTDRPWWQISDFATGVGDIKTVWEASRFEWALEFAQRAATGDPCALDQLNAWLSDWTAHNPPYSGPNWKCGQEAAIRVMHLAAAGLVIGPGTPALAPALAALLKAHLARIEATMSYALAQDNNHGTSESAALFLGGTWLAAHGEQAGRRYARRGWRGLEERAVRLIGADGSFSQYSVTYHRLMLDTYSLVEVWRRRLQLPGPSNVLSARLAAAARWLFAFTQPESGDAPNLGANDGAHILPLSAARYRDFRPSVQLACALFLNRRAYEGVEHCAHALAWLDVATPPVAMEASHSAVFNDGGFCILRQQESVAYLRFPNFRFRPSQADALHLDLWRRGVNLLRDGGTFSYNAGLEQLNYFGGTRGHNTVEFDSRDQMPRLGRFLFGAWLRAEPVALVSDDARQVSATATYRDMWGCRHRRSVQLGPDRLRVSDTVTGFRQRAVLRWRLAPLAWQLRGHTLEAPGLRLSVSADVPIVRLSLTDGAESLHYLESRAVPVLEIEIHLPGTLVTEFDMAA